MSNVENLEDHMAFSCECGCVRFNLLKSGGIECDDCGEKIDSTWGLAQPEQEPYGLLNIATGVVRKSWEGTGYVGALVEVYTTPPQRKPLTDELWDLLDAVEKELNRRAIPEAWLLVAHKAGRAYIKARGIKE